MKSLLRLLIVEPLDKVKFLFYPENTPSYRRKPQEECRTDTAAVLSEIKPDILEMGANPPRCGLGTMRPTA
jgi:hypothetical protein